MNRRRHGGFTLLEIIIVITILSVLTVAAIPMVRNSARRDREVELMRRLREMRRAIDEYRRFYEQTGGAAIPIEFKKQSGCPPSLEILVDGFVPANVVGTSSNIKRFMREIPEDPINGGKDWGLRSYKDKPESTSWGGEDVFDVYCKSDKTALNGTKYSDW